MDETNVLLTPWVSVGGKLVRVSLSNEQDGDMTSRVYICERPIFFHFNSDIITCIVYWM